MDRPSTAVGSRETRRGRIGTTVGRIGTTVDGPARPRTCRDAHLGETHMPRRMHDHADGRVRPDDGRARHGEGMARRGEGDGEIRATAPQAPRPAGRTRRSDGQTPSRTERGRVGSRETSGRERRPRPVCTVAPRWGGRARGGDGAARGRDGAARRSAGGSRRCARARGAVGRRDMAAGRRGAAVVR
jgi:hypothetical protein